MFTSHRASFSHIFSRPYQCPQGERLPDSGNAEGFRYLFCQSFFIDDGRMMGGVAHLAAGNAGNEG